MGYMGDSGYWDGKFACRPDAPLGPEKSLVESISLLKPGSVLDLACGDGRNALFLLESGFRVSGVDFSGIALARLQSFAQARGSLVDTLQLDLGIPGCLGSVGVFDNIVIVHYRLSPDTYSEIADHVSPGGVLFVTGFCGRHRADERLRQEDLIQPSDFAGLSPSFDRVKYIEAQDERGSNITCIFRKKSD